MSYKINFTDTVSNPGGITVEDQSLNLETDLTFVGKNYPGYSQFIGENFLHLLENFTGPTPPSKAIKGQLWYDSSNSQLKVYDSTNWVEAGNIKKSPSPPSISISLPGDLWVDTVNQQLYMFSGVEWILVGPQFSEAGTTGFKAEYLLDSANNENKPVIVFYIENERIAIFSKYDFVPRQTLEGFSNIRQGINLTSKTVNYKFWGTSEKANSLVVGNFVVPSSSFLRNDVVSTTNFPFNVRSSTGIKIGASLETEISSGVQGTLITQTTQNATISFRTTEPSTGIVNQVLTIADKKIGINKNPLEALDVNGNIFLNGFVKTTSTVDSTSTTTGSIQTSGGIGIVKNLFVGGNTSVGGSLTVSSSITSGNITSSGSIVANTFTGNVVGNVTGNVVGNVTGSTTRLNVKRLFSITGDITTINPGVEREFDGTTNIELETSINENFIFNKSLVVDSLESDQFLIYRQTPPSLRRVAKSTIFSTSGFLPIGSIVPFAGSTAPLGFLLCDGSEVRQTEYPDLYNVIENTYNGATPLKDPAHFRIPDLRGRFASGKETMNNGLTINIVSTASIVQRTPTADPTVTTFTFSNDNYLLGNPWSQNQFFQIGQKLENTGIPDDNNPVIASVVKGLTDTIVSVIHVPVQGGVIPDTLATVYAIGTINSNPGNPNPVRNSQATELGFVGGVSEKSIALTNIPEHTHDLQDSLNNQYYVVNSSTLPPQEAQVADLNIHFDNSYTTGLGLSNSGGISTTGQLGQPLNILNPFLTINYIIFAGK